MLRASDLKNDVRNLESEKTNTKEPIEYRNMMINDLNEQIKDRDKKIDEFMNLLNNFWYSLKRPIIILVEKLSK